MSLLSELKTVADTCAIPVETGVFSGVPPDLYLVITPMVDTFALHADDSPGYDTQEARLSLFVKGSYTAIKDTLVRALLGADFCITDRRYIARPFTSSTEVISKRSPSQRSARSVVTDTPGMTRKRNRSVASQKAAMFAHLSLPCLPSRYARTEAWVTSFSDLKPSASTETSFFTRSIKVFIFPKDILTPSIPGQAGEVGSRCATPADRPARYLRKSRPCCHPWTRRSGMTA